MHRWPPPHPPWEECLVDVPGERGHLCHPAGRGLPTCVVWGPHGVRSRVRPKSRRGSLSPPEWSELQGFSVSPVRGPRRQDPTSSVQVSDRLATWVSGRVHVRKGAAQSRTWRRRLEACPACQFPDKVSDGLFSVFISLSGNPDPWEPRQAPVQTARGPRCLCVRASAISRSLGHL